MYLHIWSFPYIGRYMVIGQHPFAFLCPSSVVQTPTTANCRQLFILIVIRNKFTTDHTQACIHWEVHSWQLWFWVDHQRQMCANVKRPAGDLGSYVFHDGPHPLFELLPKQKFLRLIGETRVTLWLIARTRVLEIPRNVFNSIIFNFRLFGVSSFPA